MLEERIRRQRPGQVWVDSLLELFGRLASPQRVRALTDWYEVSRATDADEDAQYGQALKERGVPDAMIGEILLSGMTDAAAEELRAYGLAPQAIEILRQRYGRRKGGSEVRQDV
jgi:hypothetical protein